LKIKVSTSLFQGFGEFPLKTVLGISVFSAGAKKSRFDTNTSHYLICFFLIVCSNAASAAFKLAFGRLPAAGRFNWLFEPFKWVFSQFWRWIIFFRKVNKWLKVVTCDANNLQIQPQ